MLFQWEKSIGTKMENTEEDELTNAVVTAVVAMVAAGGVVGVAGLRIQRTGGVFDKAEPHDSPVVRNGNAATDGSFNEPIKAIKSNQKQSKQSINQIKPIKPIKPINKSNNHTTTQPHNHTSKCPSNRMPAST